MTTAEEKLNRKQELEKELLKVEQDLKREQDSAEIQGDIFEKVLKQIIKSVVAELNNKGRVREIHDYPPVLHACHIQELLDVGSNKVYEILRSKGCPTVRDEKRMTVPRDLFWAWYLERARANATGHEEGDELE